MKNLNMLFKNSLNTRWGGVFARSLVLFSLSNLPVMAQSIIDPATPDNFAGCVSSVVRNTGSSAFADLQVVVVDGSDPSILFIDYSTSPPTEQCFPLLAITQGGDVIDPDVVWDYSGSGLLLVVYESTMLGSGVCSEMWDWSGGAPAPVMAYGGSGFYQFSNGAVHPNVDADLDGNAVVVWERSGDIEAMTVDFASFMPSGNTYWVNDGACGHNSAAEPDVAIRSFGGKNYVNFVMVDQGIAAGDIVVVFESFTNVQAGSANNCVSHTVQHAGSMSGWAPTRVAKPRIDMNTYINSYWAFQNPHACGVVYEMYDGSESFIASSQLMDLLGQSFPVPSPPNPFPNVVFAQTYSQPAWATNEWISEVLNSGGPFSTIVHPVLMFITQLIPPADDLRMDPNSGPVIAYVGDLITYTGWNWSDASGLRTGLDEVLSRRLMLYPDGNFQPGAIPPFNNTLYYFTIPAPTTDEYFVVGESLVNSEPQHLLSMDGTLDWCYYAFVGPNSGGIFYKRSYPAPTGAVRTAKPNVKAQLIVQTVKELTIYPNPSEGLFEIKTPHAMSYIQLIGARGELLITKEIKSGLSISQLDLNHLPSGIYTLAVQYQNASPEHKRIVITR